MSCAHYVSGGVHTNLSCIQEQIVAMLVRCGHARGMCKYPTLSIRLSINVHLVLDKQPPIRALLPLRPPLAALRLGDALQPEDIALGLALLRRASASHSEATSASPHVGRVRIDVLLQLPDAAWNRSKRKTSRHAGQVAVRYNLRRSTQDLHPLLHLHLQRGSTLAGLWHRNRHRITAGLAGLRGIGRMRARDRTSVTHGFGAEGKKVRNGRHCAGCGGKWRCAICGIDGGGKRLSTSSRNSALCTQRHCGSTSRHPSRLRRLRRRAHRCCCSGKLGRKSSTLHCGRWHLKRCCSGSRHPMLPMGRISGGTARTTM